MHSDDYVLLCEYKLPKLQASIRSHFDKGWSLWGYPFCIQTSTICQAMIKDKEIDFDAEEKLVNAVHDLCSALFATLKIFHRFNATSSNCQEIIDIVEAALLKAGLDDEVEVERETGRTLEKDYGWMKQFTK